MPRFFLSLIILLSSSALALSCEALEGAFEIPLEGLGSLFIGDLDSIQDLNSNDSSQSIRLFNGVCLVATEGWQLESEIIIIRIQEFGFSVSATDIQANVFGWTLHAERLEASPEQLSLFTLDLESDLVSGFAAEARFNLETSAISFRDIFAQTNSLSVKGDSAEVFEETLIFKNAVASTCTCADPFYSLSATVATYDYITETLSLDNGKLNISGLEFVIGDQVFSEDNFADFRIPFEIAYTEDSSSSRGTGLGIRVPKLNLSEQAWLELAVLGLDNDFDWQAVFLAHYKTDALSVVAGRNSFGPQLDVVMKQNLNSWLALELATFNKHWLEQDFLHDLRLSLSASKAVDFLNTLNVSLRAEAFLAASHQILNANAKPEAIFSTRQGAEFKVSYRTATTDWGQLSGSLSAKGTHYLAYNETQYGLIFSNQYSKAFTKNHVFRLNSSQIWTNAASPFGTTLDKLSPKQGFDFSFSGKNSLANNLNMSYSASSTFDFLKEASAWRNLEKLSLSSRLDWQQQELLISAYLRSELAALLNNSLSSSSHGYFETGVSFSRPNSGPSPLSSLDDWLFNTSYRWDLITGEPSKLELSSVLPFEIGDLALSPFIAVDFLASFEGDLPRVSGHGLSGTLSTCCGIIDFAYRQSNNSFLTEFAVRFE